ncbi:MAG: 5-formyltetrahydrofolate cyclo-ligase [Francisellaceae bacterium]|jgi:5-formyltetrahydrofolate cyclo-ligase|nr:5-formyltetrahydrofolate cyclo-ligase [Francisellaceae bacterium]MBT6208134.1 5-formyltetrahydrofolate cyclo-ligase [Francisellaceae bacterium]MBT6539923.1 5-formyltetrahydrofolate cyclo-ligase [Francisellaceae bacterium]
MQDKNSIRQKIIKQRKLQSTKTITSSSAKISSQLFNMPEYISAKTVAMYWSFGSEVDTKDILTHALAAYKLCYLPKIVGNTLNFIKITDEQELIANKYKILEPSTGASSSPNELDLILLPLVGYTESGQRIGMGSGYYDRCLATTSNMPLLIGLAYSFQEVTDCKFDEWDIKLDIIINEDEVIFCA